MLKLSPAKRLMASVSSQKVSISKCVTFASVRHKHHAPRFPRVARYSGSAMLRMRSRYLSAFETGTLPCHIRAITQPSRQANELRGEHSPAATQAEPRMIGQGQVRDRK